jgi:hypothetical protein
MALFSLIISLATVTVVWIVVATASGLDPLGPGTEQRSDLVPSSAIRSAEHQTTEDPYDVYYRMYLYERNPYYGTFNEYPEGRSLSEAASLFSERASAPASSLVRMGKTLLDRSAERLRQFQTLEFEKNLDFRT